MCFAPNCLKSMTTISHELRKLEESFGKGTFGKDASDNVVSRVYQKSYAVHHHASETCGAADQVHSRANNIVGNLAADVH